MRDPLPIRLISEAVTPKMPILWRALLSSRLPYRCQNCNENDHKKDFCRESSTNSSTRQNPNNKRALTQISLIHFPNENEICQIPAFEPTNAENLVRECNQRLRVVEIPHPSIHIQSPKPDSPRTQL
ncbi:unnamed protein product [Hymenolepis diminuta]|uniref:Uncharacterized protein n=1 Tax=Hymenolepis diminuta TaxID=6216 RepID=A0A564YPF5_HYMDI|nr:unnamed protein product [Hymenolepis diminuta]